MDLREYPFWLYELTVSNSTGPHPYIFGPNGLTIEPSKNVVSEWYEEGHSVIGVRDNRNPKPVYNLCIRPAVRGGVQGLGPLFLYRNVPNDLLNLWAQLQDPTTGIEDALINAYIDYKDQLVAWDDVANQIANQTEADPWDSMQLAMEYRARAAYEYYSRLDSINAAIRLLPQEASIEAFKRVPGKAPAHF